MNSEQGARNVKTDKGIESITVRFFILDTEEESGELDIKEVQESEFLSIQGDISYERHSVFENGCRQICLTKGYNGFYR